MGMSISKIKLKMHTVWSETHEAEKNILYAERAVNAEEFRWYVNKAVARLTNAIAELQKIQELGKDAW